MNASLYLQLDHITLISALAGFGLLSAIFQNSFKILTLCFHYRAVDKRQRSANTPGHPEQNPSISIHKFY